jgi:regulator of sigma E protease
MYLIAESSLTVLAASGVDWQAKLELLYLICVVALALGFVVFVHELGHFLVAKACGVKCEKFYVGFDIPIKIGPLRLPSRLGRFQWGETEYGIGILPLGGYVKMLGQDDDPRAQMKETERVKVQKSDDEAEGGDSAGEDYQLDPRSFPAKPVLQRMAIISAGVIMNLLTAVLFALYAFSAGVPFTPTEIGGTVPGSPAWEAGLEPGSRIIQIGYDGRRSDQLWFDWDLSHAGVGLAQDNEDLLLRVRAVDDEEKEFLIRPVMTQKQKGKMPMIGVAPARTLRIGGFMSEIPASETQLAEKDTIVAVDGQSIHDAYDLEGYLEEFPDRDVTFTVERPVGEEDEARTERLDAVVQAYPLKRMGLIMQHGPISSIRPGSPAERSEFQLGDQIVSVEGEPLGDPMRLPTRLRPFFGQEITIGVIRGDEEVEITVTPETPRTYAWTVNTGFPMAAEALGVAFDVYLQVSDVVPGSPADTAGIRQGDVLKAATFEDPENRYKAMFQRSLMLVMKRPRVFPLSEGGFDWMFLFDTLQLLTVDGTVKLEYERDGQAQIAELKPIASEDHNPNRGIILVPRQEIYTAATFQEAFSMALRKTKDSALQVMRVLQKLFTGQISPTNLGGPISIAYVAGAEASQGLSRLMLFLTFLSANLAVLNFLPIPALDGGHMLFLAAEGIRGKPVDERMQFALTLAGVACLLGLMIFVFGLDFQRFFL